MEKNKANANANATESQISDTELERLITEINDAINHRIDFLKNKHGEPFFSFGKHRLGEFDKIKELNANKENQYKTLKDQIVRFEKHQHEYTDDDKATTNAYSDIMNDNLGENIKKFLNEKPGIGWHVTQSGNPINQRNQNDDEKYNQSVKKDYAYWWFECQEEQFKSNPFSISIFIDSKGVRVKLELNNNESNEYTQMLMEKYTQMLKEKNKENEYKTEYEPGKDYANSIIDSFDKLIIHYKEVVNNMSIIQDKIGQAFSEGKKQIVLTGAPGTGKTHAARKYASDMIKQEMESESEDKIKKEQKRRIKFVQFHPSFDYTDFVEGLKPVELEKEPSEGTEENESNTSTNNIEQPSEGTEENESNTSTTNVKQQSEGSKSEYSFVRVDGIFKAFCRSIVEQNDKDKKSGKEPPYYYFIIDEINRADLSKVFGELMYGLEESYRVESEYCPQSQYSYLPTYRKKENGKWERIPKDVFADGFYIPENLRIIGTMNDIDRSVETFDFALRRRFRWIDIKANDVMANVLRGITKIPEAQIGKAVDQIIKMNGVISDKNKGGKFRLSEAFHIGPSYFKTLEYKGDKFNWADVFDKEIEPILREYVRPYNAESQTEFIDACKTALTGKDDKKTKEEDNQNGSPDNSETTNNTSTEDTEGI